ncbi:MAG: homoserine O-succinyltransferase, partial [Clostridiales bacterium]|nr:homoserine O-succinyltransferase [Clostridiales bacterium]
PHSRHTQTSKEDILANDRLTILAESEEAGIFIVMGDDGRRIFVMGHPEYDRITLDKEYKRDLAKGLEIEMPVNYYPHDDDEVRPCMMWRAHANALYSNWLNYYVYQNTPYEW